MVKKIVLLFYIISWAFSLPVYSQWLNDVDFIRAKRILVELNGADKFGIMPDVDTAALREYRDKIASWEHLFYRCIDTLSKPTPQFPPLVKEKDGMNKKERKKMWENNGIKCLAETNWKQNRNNAYSSLVYYPYNYAKLNKYRDLLLPIIRNKIHDFNDIVSYKMAGHIELPKGFRDSLLLNRKTPLYIKARLGDTLAEKAVILRFSQCAADSLLNDSLPAYVEMLFYINSSNTWTAFFDNLQTFHAQKHYFQLRNNTEIWCRWYSITYRLLLAYENYFPFEMRYFEKYIFNNPNIPDGQETIEYYAAVSKYFSEKFNRKIKIRIPYLADGALLPLDGYYTSPNK